MAVNDDRYFDNQCTATSPLVFNACLFCVLDTLDNITLLHYSRMIVKSATESI